jgi:hypothetical protein
MINLETAVETHIPSARYGTERFFNCSAVHPNGEFINGVKWLTYIVIARFRLPQLPFLGSMNVPLFSLSS